MRRFLRVINKVLQVTGKILLVAFIVAQSFLSYGIIQSIYVLNYKLKNIVRIKSAIALLEDKVNKNAIILLSDIAVLETSVKNKNKERI